MLLRCILFLTLAVSALRADETLRFSGYDWIVKQGHMGPGPNTWEPRNVFVDEQGRLHLKITHRDGKWLCAELGTRERLGFGRYQFDVMGRPDKFDDHVVLGIFNYPTRDVGADGTSEIDIEFARWNAPANPMGNFTLHPAQRGAPRGHSGFDLKLNGDYTTHRFEWTPKSIAFQSLHGHREPGDNTGEIAHYLFAPAQPERSIPQHPQPVRMNLWLFRGMPPNNGEEVEIIIKRFLFFAAEK